MPDSNRDAEPERTPRPKYDNWPIEHDDAYTDWPIERKSPGEGGQIRETKREDVEWLGFTGGTEKGAPFLYEPHGPAVYEGELDEENERIVIDDESGRREVDSEVSLGAHIEEIGEEHGWTWVSSFARKYLEDESRAEEHRSAGGLELHRTEFDRRNVAQSAPYDLGFFGSHTLVDEVDRVHLVEREFNVFPDDPGGGTLTVEVDDDYLVAEEPHAEERSGDADLVDERVYELEVDVDADGANWEVELEKVLREWHADHVGLPTDE